MTSLTSSLTLQLIDDVSKPARTVAMALKDAEASVRKVAEGMANTGVSDRFVASLSKLKPTKDDIQALTASWKKYTEAQGIAANAADRTKKQNADALAYERQLLTAQRSAAQERMRDYRSVGQALAEQNRQIAATWDALEADGARKSEEAIRRKAQEEAAAWAAYENEMRAAAAEEAAWRKEQMAEAKAYQKEQAEQAREVARVARESERVKAEAIRETATIAREAQREQAEAARETARIARESEREQIAGAREAASQQMRLAREVAAAQEKAAKESAHVRKEWLGGDHSLAGSLGAMAVGGGIIEATKEAFTAAATLQERLSQLRIAGAKPEEIEEARADYRKFAATHAGVLESEYMATYKDARVIAPTEAFDMAQLGARYRAALRNSGLPVGDNDVGNVMRIMDELGLKSMADREKFLEPVLKAQQAFGSQISTETMLSAYRNAKQSIYGWSPEFRDKIFPTLLQSSGQQGGTEMMTALSNYVGRHMQHSELIALKDAGFVNPKDLIYDKNGKVKEVRKGAKLFEEDKLQSNIAQWAWDFHDTFMKQKGASEGGFNELVDKMPRNMAALIAFLVHNEDRIKRDEVTVTQPEGFKAAENADLANNPIAGLTALKDSLEQFGAAVTSPAMMSVGKILASTAQGLQSVADWYSGFAKEHPDLAKNLAGGALVGGVVGGGALTYGALSGLMGGFGLSASATALDVSAAQLSVAAGKLSLAGGLTGGRLPGGLEPPLPNGPGKLQPLGRFSTLASLFSFGLTALNLANAPTVGSKDWASDANALNQYFDKLAAALLPKGWTKAAPIATSFDPDERPEIANPAKSPDLNPLHLDAYNFDAMRSGDDLEGRRARAFSSLPAVDSSNLETLKVEVEAGKAVLDKLNVTVSPQVDSSSIEQARAALRAFLSELAQAGALVGGLPTSFAGGAAPAGGGSGKTLRGSFTPIGPGGM